jgi:galactokinase
MVEHNHIKEQLLTKFTELFGDSTKAKYYFSPGRVNLIGEHTDYNGGHVFPCALTLGTYGIAKKRDDGKINLYSINMEEVGVVKASLDDLIYRDSYSWGNYILGMVWAFFEKGHPIDSGFDLVIWGNIPGGAGLSSSASLEVLTGVILKDIFKKDNMSMVEIALLGQFAENNFCGCNCGIMDQFTVAMGKKDHAIFLDTNDLSYEYAPIVLENAKIVITNSKISHSLVDSEYNTRRKECEDALSKLQEVVDVESLGELDIETFEKFRREIGDATKEKRAKHAVYENQRTIEAVKSLKEGDIEKFGKLMKHSHISLRDDYQVSCPEVDILVDLAWNVIGVLGSRITGGGFGGCTVSIVKNDSVDKFIKVVGEGYKDRVGIEPEFYIVDIGDGARVLT